MLATAPVPAPEIIITARALPDPAAEKAFDVVTIDEQRLRNSASSQLDQLLKDIPGLQLFRRSDARSAHPTSQGVTLRALGGNASSRALLVLDGVPQADPFGGWVNWPAYDPASLAEVRIVRGGGSVGNGPGALGGTIAMRSRLAEATSAELAVGSRGSAEARLFAGTGAFGGILGVSGRVGRGDGFVPVTAETRGAADRPAPYSEASLRGIWAGRIGGSTELQAAGLAFTDRRDRGVDFTANRTDGGDISLRLIGKGHLQWSALAYAQWRELRSSFASVDAARAEATRVSLQDAVPSRAIGGSVELRPRVGPSMELRFGADMRAVTGESRELYAYADGAPTRRRRASGQSWTGGLFAELGWTVSSVGLSAGARIDHWRIFDGELTERDIASGASLRDEQPPDRSGWLPTARAGATFGVTSEVTLRSAAYLGWRMPTLNELFRPFRAGADATAANPALDPERLAGAEAGIDFKRGPLTLSTTAFVNRLDSAIANVTLAHGPGTFPGVGFVGPTGEYRQRQNLEAIRVHGLEASAEFTEGHFRAGLGASLTGATVRATGPSAALDGLRPAQTPRFTASASVGWASAGYDLSLALRRVGAQFEDDLNANRLPPATTIDAFAAMPIARRMQLVLRGENLLDRTVVAGIGGEGIIERAQPRTLWAGLRFTR